MIKHILLSAAMAWEALVLLSEQHLVNPHLGKAVLLVLLVLLVLVVLLVLLVLSLAWNCWGCLRFVPWLPLPRSRSALGTCGTLLPKPADGGI